MRVLYLERFVRNINAIKKEVKYHDSFSFLTNKYKALCHYCFSGVNIQIIQEQWCCDEKGRKDWATTVQRKVQLNKNTEKQWCDSEHSYGREMTTETIVVHRQQHSDFTANSVLTVVLTVVPQDDVFVNDSLVFHTLTLRFVYYQSCCGPVVLTSEWLSSLTSSHSLWCFLPGISSHFCSKLLFLVLNHIHATDVCSF